MQVILLERVAKLGQMGEIVNVKDGYARNYLLPQKKALWASDVNIKAFEGEKAQLEARNLESKKEADGLADKLNGQQFIVIRQASDSGSLYGSVTPRDAADVATAEGFSVDKRQVSLTAPIKDLGMHTVLVTLHPEVEASIELNVARSEEEAELQAAGINIADQAAEEEAQAEIEIAELFDEIGAAELDELETLGDSDDAEEAAPAEAEAEAEVEAPADEADAEEDKD